MEIPIQEMFKLAKQALKNAYVPLCKFPVGACIRTVEGQLFYGCNWENAATPLSQCAETSAISQMLSNGYRKISEVVLVAEKIDVCTPCGACRQRLFEFADDNVKIYACGIDGKINKIFELNELLPAAFRFDLKAAS